MPNHSLKSLQRLVWTALMAALITIGAYVHLPLGPVPFSLQSLFILLAGFILGPQQGMLAVLLYLLAGLGLPVYAGGQSGLSALLGPTAGYLLGFVLAAAISGVATKKQPHLSWLKGFLWGTLALIPVYVLGVGRLACFYGLKEALMIGLVPFIPAALLKLFLATAVYRFMYQRDLLPEC